MAAYSINDLEKITGIKAHTIRIWEKRYEVVQPFRTPTNIRFYSENDLIRLLNISTLNKHGFRISEIVAMSPEEITGKISDFSGTGADFEYYVNNLVLAMLNLDADLFEKVFSGAILKIGFEKTITKIVYPLLEKIGIFWQIGTINPGQEHFITNLIRQKLIVAIDSQTNRPLPNHKTFLLFLPEKEYHELGLLFLNYLIRKNGHKSYFLGQNVPYVVLDEICAKTHVDFLVTYLIASITKKEIPKYLQKLSVAFPDKTIFVTGIQIRENSFQMPSNVIAFNTSFELLEIVQSLPA